MERKRNIEGLTWDRGSGERPGSDPAGPGSAQETTAHLSSLLLHAFPALPRDPTMANSLFTTGERRKRNCAHTVISCGGGIQSQEGPGIGDWRTAPFPVYDLMQVKGEAWSSTASLSSAPHWRPLFRYLLNLLRSNRRLCKDRLGIGWHTSFHAREAMNGEPNKVSPYPIP